MNSSEFKKSYFSWLTHIIDDKYYLKGRDPSKLLQYLHSVNYFYVNSVDSSREEDGLGLRHYFAHERGIPILMCDEFMEGKSCSVLEMLVALSVRAAERVFNDPKDPEPLTGKFFWNMIQTIGVNSMIQNFDAKEADEKIMRLLQRDYEHDGKGGLFCIPNCSFDMRTVSVWFQLSWYLDYLENHD